MTEPLPPLTDEDLSLVLDGEAASDVVARVQADPEARARLDAMRSASDLLRQTPVPPLDPATVDRLIGRALDEGAPAGVDDESAAEPGGAVVHPLPQRSRAPGGVPRWLVAAAIVALVGVGLALVWSGRDTTRQDDAASYQTSGEAERAADGTADKDGAEPAPSDAPASSTTAGSAGSGTDTAHGEAPADSNTFDLSETGLVDLGTFTDADALREALKASFPDSSARFSYREDAKDGLTTASVNRCDTQVRTLLSIDGQATNRGLATVAGQLVLVYEYEVEATKDGSPTTLVAGVLADACDPVVTFER